MKKSEVDIVYNLITDPAGYDIGCSGRINISQYKRSIWTVEWEEYHNPHDNYSKSEMEALEFDDPRKAAECFIELRHLAEIGLDFDKIMIKEILKEMQPRHYLLGKHLKVFKEKYSMKKYKCPFKQYQLVKFVYPGDIEKLKEEGSNYPFEHNEIVLFLGEIIQMEGHCIVVKGNGKIYWGYHTDNFVEPDEDEI